VVIAIIAVLSAIIAPSAFRAIGKAKAARALEDVKSIKTAAIAFYSDAGLWPGSQWGTMPGDPYSPAVYGEGFVTPPIVHSGTAAEIAQAQRGLSSWDGPYLEKWADTPWGMPYMWDYNNWDASGDGVSNEHIVWLDLEHSGVPADPNTKVPASARDSIDRQLDGADGLHRGMVQMNGTETSLMVIVVQGY
jgi:general secretion pathway protein G